MKRSTIALIISPVLSIVSLYFSIQFFLPTYIKKQIIEKGSAALGTPLSVQNVQIHLYPNLAVSVEAIQADYPKAPFSISAASIALPVSMDLLHKKFAFQLIILEPKISAAITSLTESNNNPKEQEATVYSTPQIQLTGPLAGTQLSASIIIQNGSIEVVDKSQQKLAIHKINSSLQIPSLETPWTLTLKNDLDVQLESAHFASPVELEAQFPFSMHKLELKNAQLRLFGISVGATGTTDLAQKSHHWRLHLDSKDLSKVPAPEQIIPDKHWSGAMKINLTYDKDFNTAGYLKGAVAIEQLQANIHKEAAGAKIAGPVLISTLAQFHYDKSFVLEQLSLDAQLSQAEVKFEHVFHKPAGTALSIKAAGSWSDVLFDLQQFSLKLGTMFTTANAKVAFTANSLSSANLQIQKSSINDLLKLLPGAAPQNIAIEGPANFEGSLQLRSQDILQIKNGITKWPASINASLNTDFTKLIYKSQPQQEPAKSTSKEELPPEPLLPKWTLFSDSTFSTKIKISALDWGSLKVANALLNAQIKNGELSSTGSLDKVFGGNAAIKKLQLNLLSAQPSTLLNATVKQVDIAPMIEWIAPSYKGLVSGIATGDIDGVITHPSKKDFLQSTNLKGQLLLKNGFLSTIKFDQLAKEKLAKIPGVGDKLQLNSKGAAANILAKFQYTNAQLTLAPLQILTPEKNELLMNGSVGLDKNLSLVGKIYLSDVPIKGAIRAANSDKKGRFVLDAKVTGNAFSPELHLADTTLQNLARKTIEAEVKKQIDNAKAEVKKKVEEVQKNAAAQVQKEVQKKTGEAQKQLIDDAQKKLKGLFGQ